MEEDIWQQRRSEGERLCNADCCLSLLNLKDNGKQKAVPKGAAIFY
jgi:hypothetical protein